MGIHLKDLVIALAVAYGVASYLTWSIYPLPEVSIDGRFFFLIGAVLVFACIKIWRI